MCQVCVRQHARRRAYARAVLQRGARRDARGSAGGGGDTLALLSARLERAQQRIQVGSFACDTSQIVPFQKLQF